MITDSPTIGNPESNTLSVLSVLHPPGSTVEIRSFGVDGRNNKSVSGYYRDLEKAAHDVADLEKRNPSAIYVVMNAVNPDLFARSPNRMIDYPKHSTADKDITRRRWLLIDVDPERPAGLSSTDEELEAANRLAADLRDWLTERMGWPEPVEAMSGNGWHLLFPINLPNDDDSTKLVKGVLEAVKAEAEKLSPVDAPSCKVDTSVSNAARITKLYGTMVRKGGDIPERPHRQSSLVYVPSHLGWEGR